MTASLLSRVVIMGVFMTDARLSFSTAPSMTSMLKSIRVATKFAPAPCHPASSGFTGLTVPPPDVENMMPGAEPSLLVPVCIACWTQPTPVSTSSPNVRLMMAVSMTTCESMMSICLMMSRIVIMSFALDIIMRALVRSSERRVMFSLSSWPIFVRAPAATSAAGLGAATGAVGDASPRPGAVARFASSSAGLRLPMSSLSRLATSLATACSRR